jgi:hypothetical protein
MNSEDYDKDKIPLNDDEYKELDTTSADTTQLKQDWDKDEIARDPRTYQTEEGTLKSLYHMLERYCKLKGIKLNTSEQSKDEASNSLMNIKFYDKEFHKFVLENYGLVVHYDKKNNKFSLTNQ